MDNKSNFTFGEIYWNEIFNFLELNSIMSLELVNKELRTLTKKLYKSHVENLPLLKYSSEYKKDFVSLYYNAMIKYPIQMEYCNMGQSNGTLINQEDKDGQTVNKNASGLSMSKAILFSNIDMALQNNKAPHIQMFLPDNILFTLTQGNIFNIFGINSSLKSLVLSKSNNFKEKIKKFTYVPPVNSFIFLDHDGKIYLMDCKPNNNTMIPYPSQSLLFRDIFYIKSYLVFIDLKGNFYYVYLDNFPLTEEQIEISKNEEPIKYISIEKTFEDFSQISIAEGNFMVLGIPGHQLFYMTTNDLNKANQTNIQFRTIADRKFSNVHACSSGESHWLVLEKEYVPPIEKWSVNDVLQWFEEMKLDDYLNIIKYEKITGKDIYEADETFLVNCMGMQEDDMKKIKYQITQVRYPSYKNIKLWGWGNNKQGQLGMMNFNASFIKSPTLITLPTLDDCLDTIDQIYCGESYSVIVSKFGQIFVTGNYNAKEKQVIIDKQNALENPNKKNSLVDKRGNHQKKVKDIEKVRSKEIVPITHRWIDVTKEICFDSLGMNGSEFLKIRRIFINKQGMFIFGYKMSDIPFNMIMKKPKFKHLKKGDKFITSDGLIEYIISQKKEIKDNINVVYTDACLKLLETSLDEFLLSEVPYHKIVQIKSFSNILWDRKKRYLQEDFFK